MTVSENALQEDYESRISRVFQYIDENLDADLSLNILAEIAFFSAFHFHRIFKAIVGETLNDYITRRRIEKAAADLLHTSAGITEVALIYGFNNNTSFTRTFHKFYGVSPTEFRKQNPNKFSKIRPLESKNGQVSTDSDKYVCVINNLKNWTRMNAKIEVKEILKMDLAYVSCIGPQNLESAYQRLVQWATPKGLLQNRQTKMITLYHDSYKITEASKVRLSACITLHKPEKLKGKIGLTSIAAGKYLVGSYEIGLTEFEKSWTGLFIWMNENGYKKAARNPFEIYHNNFHEHPEKKCMVDFCIPIQ